MNPTGIPLSGLILKSESRPAWVKFSGLALILLIALGWKAALSALGRIPFNADEAIVGLMARHILQGERPVFFYGQAYMGSLDAWLAAGAFLFLGPQVGAIRLVQGILYAGTILTTAWLGKIAFGTWKIGLLAALLLAVPVVNVTLYTTVSLGGYGETLFLGNLILLAALWISRETDLKGATPAWPCLALGFLIGFGFWASGLTLVYSLPAGLYLAWKLVRPGKISWPAWRAVLLSLAGVLPGAAPILFFAASHGWQAVLAETSGSAIAGVEHGIYLTRIAQHTLNFLLLGSTVVFGMRPPWEVRWLALPLLPFVLIFWMGTIAYWFNQRRNGLQLTAGQRLLWGQVVTLIAAFILTPFGVDPSGRYFLPFVVPMALFAAGMIVDLAEKRPWLGLALPVLLLVSGLWGTLECALRLPPGLSTQFDAVTWIDHRHDDQLISFLREHGETRGYTNYWVSYPLAFQSQEELLFVPRLPYHQDFRYSERDDRYDPYDQQVNLAGRVAYISTFHPALDERLRSGFTRLGVAWQEIRIGDYQVFYNLSRPVRPAEIGLGKTTP